MVKIYISFELIFLLCLETFHGIFLRIFSKVKTNSVDRHSTKFMKSPAVIVGLKCSDFM
jgi:hypothetical protein